jgi:hypothetical protein
MINGPAVVAATSTPGFSALRANRPILLCGARTSFRIVPAGTRLIGIALPLRGPPKFIRARPCSNPGAR